MAQSLNRTVELSTTGVSYLNLAGNSVGKFLLGDVALEFYADNNVENYVQIPWSHIDKIGANVSGSLPIILLLSEMKAIRKVSMTKVL